MEPGKYTPHFVNSALFKVLAAGVLSLALVAAALWAPPLGRAEQGVPLTTFTDTLDARMPRLMKTYGIPGTTMALVKDGRVAWTRAYGFADLKAKRKMTVDTFLRVQSLSKPVTAWGVMKLIEQGIIELDSPVARYITSWEFPPSPFSADRVTVRQLLCHCSGLPLGDIWNMYSPKEKVPALRQSLTKDAVLISEPGSRFSYSNTGYNLLELLIEEVTGRDFAEYMKQEVLLPLGMEHASFTWSEQLRPEVPLGYNLSGRAIPVYVYPEKGSGGLFASVGDMAAFAAAGMPHSGQRVLSPEGIETLYTPAAKDLGMYRLVFDSYGFGFYLEDLSDGRRAVAHGGQGTGWMTHLHAVPETGDGIVILTNSQRSWPFIAYLLRAWRQWNGFAPLGMENILLGEYALGGVIFLIFFLTLFQAFRLGEGLFTGERVFMPRTKNRLLLRLVQGGLSAALMAVLMWCVSQKYLFISSVFPISAVWLGISAFAFALVLLLSALFPYHGRRDAGVPQEDPCR